MAEGIRYALEGNLITDFTRGGKRCVRFGTRYGARRERGARVELPHMVQLVAPNKMAWRSAFVFRVSLSPEVHAKWGKQPQTYHVVAENARAVESYLQKRYTNIAKQFMGTARYAMTEAMRRLSTRSVSHSGRLGPKAPRTGAANIVVRSFGGDAEWTVAVEDSLSYAAKAFKSGQSAVELAMAKAANSVAAYLQRRAGNLLDPAVDIPFPEIAKHRHRRFA